MSKKFLIGVDFEVELPDDQTSADDITFDFDVNQVKVHDSQRGLISGARVLGYTTQPYADEIEDDNDDASDS